MPITEKVDSNGKRSRGRPRRPEAAELERLLLEFALAEFLEHGYGGASLSRIVRQAGISKTTLYSRYASKEAIFLALIEQQADTLSAEFSPSSGLDCANLAASLKRYACHMLDVSLREDIRSINRLLYSESHRFPALGEAAAKRTRKGVERVTGLVREWSAQSGTPCRHPEAVAEVFILSIRGWYIDVMLTNRRVSAKALDRWVDQTIHVVLSAIEEC